MSYANDQEPDNNIDYFVMFLEDPDPIFDITTTLDGNKTLTSTFTNTTGELVSYRLLYDNQSVGTSHLVDILDTFSGTYLDFVDASIPVDTTGSDTLFWDDVTVDAGDTLVIDVDFVLTHQVPVFTLLENEVTYDAVQGEYCRYVTDADDSNNASSTGITVSVPLPSCGVADGEIFYYFT